MCELDEAFGYARLNDIKENMNELETEIKNMENCPRFNDYSILLKELKDILNMEHFNFVYNKIFKIYNEGLLNND